MPVAGPYAKPYAKSNRRCEYCGAKFAVERSTARFCSDAHRVEAHRRRLKAAAFRGHLRTSASHEWHTPTEVVEAARRALGGIDLDPASCEAADRIVRAARYYDEEQDGLARPWLAETLFLNPPYGRLAPLFARKFARHFPRDVPRAILLLANHHLSTRWFGCLAALDPVVCLMSYRLRFSGSASQPAHGSVILGFEVDEGRFRDAFAGFGWIRS